MRASTKKKYKQTTTQTYRTFVTPTLLAGDRSLADVVAHEIAHSWTGNLVTNATWDHFWLNEGWTVWLQRKITSRLAQNDKVLDFEALGGLHSLQKSVDFMPQHTNKLVLEIGTGDPDDFYSSVPYEKGFNLLMVLERRVGKVAFESFFQTYIEHYANQTLTSEDFKGFFLNHFRKQKTSLDDFDWDAWFHDTGMPPELVDFDKTMGNDSEQMAALWLAVDRDGRMLPSDSNKNVNYDREGRVLPSDSKNVKSWSTNQTTLFLDTLKSATEDLPLSVDTVRAMDRLYGFAETKNAEILCRYCELAVAAEDESILPIVLQFCTSQGRMKFVRPLYRALFASNMGRQAAQETFLRHADFYHPICSKMIAQDLKRSNEKGKSKLKPWGSLSWSMGVGVAAVAAIGATVFLRRTKR